MSEEITGYHGTNSNNVESIKQNNFTYEHDTSHWLGDGIYFFIDGIGEEPINLAAKWAIAAAWNDDNQEYNYERCSVLKSDINLEGITILNLTEDKGLDLFNKYRRRLLDTLSYYDLKEEYSGNHGFEYDFKLLEHIKNNSSVGVIISHLYVKFTKERKGLVRSRIPNCTIMSVDSQENIDEHSIEEIYKGRVDNG
ncbi:MAG: hypothetical protein K9K32_07505 [Halanaerobiales bacterium]|nr:hypothetical protein [Halanaerobiales bacterium]